MDPIVDEIWKICAVTDASDVNQQMQTYKSSCKSCSQLGGATSLI